jgi:hypothetical protein
VNARNVDVVTKKENDGNDGSSSGFKGRVERNKPPSSLSAASIVLPPFASLLLPKLPRAGEYAGNTPCPEILMLAMLHTDLKIPNSENSLFMRTDIGSGANKTENVILNKKID